MKGYRRMKFSHLSFKELSSKALTSLIISAYLIVIFLIYPFFMKNGYVGIANAKYEFFLYSSLITILLLLLTGFVPLVNSFKKFLVTDIFVILFTVVTIVSYFVSPYRTQAFIGSEDWNMGFLTWIVLIMLYFLISRLWDFSKVMLYVALIGSFGVFLLGILDRFSLYILPLETRNPSYISTLGNINWFMGYYSVLVPIGVGLWCNASILAPAKRSVILKILLGIYVIVAFAAGFAQGGESVLLFDAALFAGILFFVLRGRIKIKMLFLTIAFWGFGALVIRIMRLIPGLEFNYETTGVCARLSEGNLMLAVTAVAIVLWLVLSLLERNEQTGKVFSTISRVIAISIFVLMSIGVIGWVIIGILKTNTDILDGFENSVFYFDIRFGSGRGLAFWAGFKGIESLGPGRFFIGIGPDCFDQFVYSLSGVGDALRFYWPADRLTNAHSELLTMMVNEGVPGLLAYLGIFVSSVISVSKRIICREETEFSVIGICIVLSVVCYLVHNLISFSQILNTPFIFIVLGVGGSLVLNSLKEA